MSTILYEILAPDLPIPGSATAGGALYLFGAGFETPLAPGDARGVGHLFLVGAGVGTDPPPPPPPAAEGGSIIALSGYARGFTPTGVGGGELALTGYSHGTIGANDAYGFGSLALTGAATAEEGTSIPGEYANAVYEGLALDGAQVNDLTAVLREIIAMNGALTTVYEGANSVVEAVSFDAAAASILCLLVAEGVAFNGNLVDSRIAIERVIESLLLTGQVASYAEAVDIVTVGIVFGQLASGSLVGSAAESVAFNAAISDALTGVVAAIEALALHAAPLDVLTAMIVVDEAVAFDAATVTAGEFVNVVSEAITFATRLTIDNEQYIAWVLNTDSKGLSRYTNFNFNSFAKIGSKYYGASADGLHRLSGDNDNGTAIAARIRLGLSSMGTRRLKRIPDAFIGYTSDGTLLLKVITINETTGAKQAAHYKLATRGAASIRENRFQIGRGMKSVDWDFVLENVEGADFDLHSVQFRPLILDRRTRG